MTAGTLQTPNGIDSLLDTKTALQSAEIGATASSNVAQKATPARIAEDKSRNSGRARLLGFLRHMGEMCAAMCVGAPVLGVLYFAVAKKRGYSNPIRELPELTTLIFAFNMAAPVAAWMRYRGKGWRQIAEISSAYFAESILLIVVSRLGILRKRSLFIWQHALCMVAMAVPMLFRLDLYTRQIGHSGNASGNQSES